MATTKWSIESRKIVFSSKWFNISKNSVKLPSTRKIDYYVVEGKDAVMVAAFDELSNIVLKKEYRLPVDSVLLELPAGSIEAIDNSPLEAAKRELYEETGYVAKDWICLGYTYDCPDRCSGKLYQFIALNAYKQSKQHLDETEEIDVVVLNLDEVMNMCFNGDIIVNSCSNLMLKAKHLLDK